MIRHMDGTNIDYDIFDISEGRGIQIIRRRRFGLLKSITTKMISKKLVYSYAGIKDMRVRKRMLKGNLSRTIKGTDNRHFVKIFMEALGYSVVDIRCIERELDI